MASRRLFNQAYQSLKDHMSEVLAVGAAGGCTITAALYARGRQRALNEARRNFGTKTGAAAEAAEGAGAARQAAAAAGQAAKKGVPRYSYSTTEKFALALWHG